jgi:hypothetical protein
LLEENIDKFDNETWCYLAQNPNPNALHILEQNIDEFDDPDVWYNLTDSTNAIH